MKQSIKEYVTEHPYIVSATLGVFSTLLMGRYLYKKMNGPLYIPGALGKIAINLPVNSTPSQDKWQVEEGIEIHHFSKGNGKNVIIVHGGPGIPYRESWPGLDPLCGEYAFHYYDQRGSGESTRPIDRLGSNFFSNMKSLSAGLGLAVQVADIERIRLILGDEKIIVIGHSFGGFIASLYAAEFPEHVESLILISPAPMLKVPMDEPGLFETVREKLPERLTSEYDEWRNRYFDFSTIFQKTDDDLVKLGDEFLRFYEVIDPSVIDVCPPGARSGGWMVFAMFFSMGRQHDYISEMRHASEIPTLIIHSENDLVQTRTATQLYLEVFPNAQFQIIENSGHWPFFEQPQTFNKVISDFLS